MRAMAEVADKQPAIQKRIDLFRHRVLEELYDVRNDPDCLNNLISNKAHQDALSKMRSLMTSEMKRLKDPLLPAFMQRNDRNKVDEILSKVYGKRAKPSEQASTKKK